MVNLTEYSLLFVHRADVFAQQQPDGAYFPVRRPIEELDIMEHLDGLASYGTYVIDPSDQTVGYVVFDLDTYDEGALLFLCNEVENLLMVTWAGGEFFESLLLESSGGKGFHIWCFFDERVPARQARYWAAPVKEAYDRARAEGLNKWPALEVFPKQDEVPEGGFGNLVKLPLGVHAKSGKRSEILGYQGWSDSVDKVQRLPSRLLPVPPAPEQRRGGQSGQTRFACVNRILEEGAPQGVRDNAMLHLAHYARGCGLPQDMALEWCLRVNEEFSPPLTRQEVNQKVGSAFRLSAPHPSCNQDWLRDFCPGGNDCCARQEPASRVRNILDEWRARERA